MKELKFICAQPDDKYFVWQVHLWLESLKEIGHSDKAICLVFTPKSREQSKEWQKIVDLYPESEFFFYKAEEDLNQLLGIYIPVLRPYILSKYFKLYPELKEKAIFYCDSDILFTEKFNISHLLNDDICYLSDTNSYISASYFDGKEKDVLPEKLEQYKTADIFTKLAEGMGISREIAEKNNLNSGGAQYLLKNIDAEFWEKVMRDCIQIRRYLQNVNKFFFESENRGFQSWCADMWAVLWALWYRGQETKVVKELDFAFSSDNISKFEEVSILHNSGITGDIQNDIPVFYKGRYHIGTDPFKDDYFYSVAENEANATLCNGYYVKKMLELHKKYKLEY